MKILSSALAAAVLISALAVNMAVAADDIRIWDGSVAEEYAGGTGTADDPYLIATAEQLARMIGYDVNTNYTDNITNGSTNKYYKLTADIYLNDVSADNWYEESGLNEWYGTANSRFCGSFDGGGYTVYGLYGSGTESFATCSICSVRSAVTCSRSSIGHSTISSSCTCKTSLA